MKDHTLHSFLIGLMAVVLLLSPLSQANEIQAMFSHIGKQQGLSHLSVKAISQDEQGYLWFATPDGLNRYDGYEVKVYRHQANEPDSLSDNNVMSLLLDRQGRLWVATLQGLNLYIPATDSFRYYPAKNHPPIRIFSLYETNSQDILIGTNGAGIFKIDEKNHQVIPFSSGNNLELKVRKIKVLKEFNRRLLIGTDKGLFIFNRQKNTWSEHHFSYQGGKDLFSDDINDIYVNSDNEVFIASLDGLHVMDLANQQFDTRVKSNTAKDSLSDNAITSISAAGNNELWLGSQNGISSFELTTGKVSRIVQEKNDSRGLSSNQITTLYQDSTGLLWVGTRDSGVNLYNPKTKHFGWLKDKITATPCLANNEHFNIIKSRNGELWLDASKQGVYRINFSKSTCRKFPELAKKLREKQDSVSTDSLFEDSRGDIWLGTKTGAIYRLKKDANSFQRFLGKSKQKLRPGALRAIVEDEKGNLWMGFDNAGVRYLDYQNEQFEQFIYDKNSNSISSNFVFSLALDDQVLWIGSETGGLDKYDIKNNTFSHYWHTSGQKNGFRTGVYSLLNDPFEYLWAGTKGQGLARLNKKTGQIRYFSSADGLPNNTVYKVLMDNQGLLWLATNNGLARFDPKTNISTNFYTADGLQDNDFNTGGFFDSKSNQLFFIGLNGVNRFNPLDITDDHSKVRTVITDFLLFNRPNRQLLKKNANDEQVLNLSYQQNLFSFSFAGLHFVDPKRQQYRYKMQGFDESWRDTDARYRVATYTNLDPGHYLFRVQASNQHGIWGDEARVKLTISPPFWLTWWAKLSYFVLTLSILAFLYRFRTRSLRIQTQLLESRVEVRTQELFQEKQRVETLLQNKTKEFENISHEFRTPLAIIIGRTQQRLEAEITQEDKTAFELIESISQRLALTVDDVIELARIQHADTKDHFQLISISSMLSELCRQMSAFASLKQQHYVTELSDDIYQYCQPKAIEKLCNNLISNAIKYTPPGGTISVLLFPFGEKHYQLAIKDTGTGIEKKLQEEVFSRFFRCNDQEHLQVEGSGIGLSLVKDVVTLHQGEIELVSAPGQGSTFTITFARAMPSDQASQFDINRRHIEVMMSQTKGQHKIKPAPAPQSAKLPSLLLVEDNTELRLLLQDQLAHSYRVNTAINGIDGLEQALTQVPEIIVSDINMPQMDGYQLLDKLKNHPGTSHIPVVLLTAKSDANSRVTGFKYKADGYIGKPYHLEELLALLAAQQYNRKQLRAHILESLQNQSPLESAGLDEYSSEVINKCIAYIQHHYQEVSLSLQALLDVACLSERQLQRKFQETLGMTPGEFINDYRLQTSRPLLKQSIKVNEVALRVGFSSANYFSRQYKKKYGLSPSQESKRALSSK